MRRWRLDSRRGLIPNRLNGVRLGSPVAEVVIHQRPSGWLARGRPATCNHDDAASTVAPVAGRERARESSYTSTDVAEGNEGSAYPGHCTLLACPARAAPLRSPSQR